MYNTITLVFHLKKPEQKKRKSTSLHAQSQKPSIIHIGISLGHYPGSCQSPIFLINAHSLFELELWIQKIQC